MKMWAILLRSGKETEACKSYAAGILCVLVFFLKRSRFLRRRFWFVRNVDWKLRRSGLREKASLYIFKVGIFIMGFKG